MKKTVPSVMFVAVVALVACGGGAPPSVKRPGPEPACDPAESTTGAVFDRQAAAEQTRVDVSSCLKKEVPKLSGRVEVVFCPADGATHSATLIDDPFGDEETRKCVEAKFMGLHVPPFSGKPVHVKRALPL